MIHFNTIPMGSYREEGEREREEDGESEEQRGVIVQ
jgi:hypothetical protein